MSPRRNPVRGNRRPPANLPSAPANPPPGQPPVAVNPPRGGAPQNLDGGVGMELIQNLNRYLSNIQPNLASEQPSYVDTGNGAIQNLQRLVSLLQPSATGGANGADINSHNGNFPLPINSNATTPNSQNFPNLRTGDSIFKYG